MSASETAVDFALNCARKGDRVCVVSLPERWGARQRLSQMGIHVGDTLTVKRSAVLGGPLVIEVHGSEVALGRGMAKQVVVRSEE